ncbi:MAG: hypothetical protein Q8R39_00085 [bacterium]|nr:hypothetical protein [bacterium]
MTSFARVAYYSLLALCYPHLAIQKNGAAAGRTCYTERTSTVGKAHLKPLIAVALSCIAVLGLIVLLHRPERYENAAPQPANIIATLTEKALVESERDSDSDGLEDWEEILWKTDTHNADTDGDGTNDGAEAGTGRDPTVAGPDDKIKTTSTPAPKGVNEGGSDDGSVTAAVGKELLSKYFVLKQSGGEIDPETAKRLVEDSISGLSDTRAVRTYSTADIIIAERDSKGAIRDYGNAVGAIVTRYSPTGSEREMVIFTRALQSDKAGEVAKLDPIIVGYRAIRDGALATPVPLSASVLHLRMINAVERYSATLSGLRRLQSDPLVALLSFSAIQKDAEGLLAVLQDVERFFRERGIEYAKGEDGYAFANALAGVQ